jgi:predicted small lipoprotein YifL
MMECNYLRGMMRILVIIFIACLTLSACGTKGPLYIPEQQYPVETKSGDGTSQKMPSPKSSRSDQTPY